MITTGETTSGSVAIQGQPSDVLTAAENATAVPQRPGDAAPAAGETTSHAWEDDAFDW